MGRKIDIKKIENVTKCQVTFSKRRSSLMKKANEIAVCCDVDVAFIAFSPSGRVTKFSNQKRIEDVLNRYVNLPAEMRLNHISDVEVKMEKLKQLSHINGDHSKLQFLDKQIENLELQIKKSGLELQILETDLRDYELGPDQEPSLHQLSWCERNLNHSLQRVMARKDFLQKQIELQNQTLAPFPNYETGQPSASSNPITGQMPMQLNPPINPYSVRVRDILQDLFDQENITINHNIGQSTTPNSPNFPIQEPAIFGSETIMPYVQISQPHIPLEVQQPLMMNQPLLNFHDQINVNPWNNTSPAIFSDATHMSTPSLWDTLDPSFFNISAPIITAIPNPSLVEMPQVPLFEEMGTGMQYANPTMTNQLSNMEGQQIGSQLNMDQIDSFINENPTNDNLQLEEYCRINGNPTNDNDNVQRTDQVQDAYTVQPPEEVCEAGVNASLFMEHTIGDNTLWTSELPRTGLWEWDDLVDHDQNFNFPSSSQA